MKFTKKCDSTQHKISKRNKLDRRRSSAGMFYTSSAGAVTSLILMLVLGITGATNLLGLGSSAYAADNISLTVDTNNLTINMAPMSSSGEFAKSGNMNIGVSTTSTSGYTLSIASSTGSTDLTNQSDNTKKINSLSSAISESDFSSSTNTQYNNKWGYKPSQYVTMNGDDPVIHPNTNYRPLPGTGGEIIAKTSVANPTADNYTLSIGARATNATTKGNYTSDTFVITAVTNSLPLTVIYDGNGLIYGSSSRNLVYYNSTTTTFDTKYSHTSNIDDSGTASGTYPASQATKDVITLPGAPELNVNIYYATRGSSYATAYVFTGEYTGSITNNTSGYLKRYRSGQGTTKETANTDSFTVTGDTATFGFYSGTNSRRYYGYYAIITANPVTTRTVASGEYATPTGTNVIFHGWSTTQTTAGGGLPSQVEYTDEADVMANMPGDEGETKTLYAVWQQGYPITFTKDSNVTKIDVLDTSGATVGTITSSGQSLALIPGDTYTIKPTHTTGYGTNAITKTSGVGTISGKQFTVGTGSATLSVTSRGPLSPIQNFNCSSLASGATEEVYDTRDNEVYLIGKLAGGKCWMLDNLRLDLTNSTILNGLTTSNTHVDSASLTSLKSGNRGAGDQYASSGFEIWDSSHTSNYYNQAKANADYKDTTTTSYGAGSGKI